MLIKRRDLVVAPFYAPLARYVSEARRLVLGQWDSVCSVRAVQRVEDADDREQVRHAVLSGFLLRGHSVLTGSVVLQVEQAKIVVAVPAPAAERNIVVEGDGLTVAEPLATVLKIWLQHWDFDG
jgi:hypothetical protein